MSRPAPLREIMHRELPEIMVGTSDSQPMKGPGIIPHFVGRYSVATIRYHLSILSKDANSPIAKASSGQGYYLVKPLPSREEIDRIMVDAEQAKLLAIAIGAVLEHAFWPTKCCDEVADLRAEVAALALPKLEPMGGEGEQL